MLGLADWGLCVSRVCRCSAGRLQEGCCMACPACCWALEAGRRALLGARISTTFCVVDMQPCGLHCSPVPPLLTAVDAVREGQLQAGRSAAYSILADSLAADGRMCRLCAYVESERAKGFGSVFRVGQLYGSCAQACCAPVAASAFSRWALAARAQSGVGHGRRSGAPSTMCS